MAEPWRLRKVRGRRRLERQRMRWASLPPLWSPVSYDGGLVSNAELADRVNRLINPPGQPRTSADFEEKAGTDE